jgi:4-cresol dehydrogenase (hydroxylating) cytochrome subunit
MLRVVGKLCAVVVSAWAGWAQEGGAEGAADAAQPAVAGQWQSGEQAWEQVCARCHTTGVGPELRGRAIPSDYVISIVRMGFLAMPAFPHSHIDDATLSEVAAMIESSAPPETEAQTEEN